MPGAAKAGPDLSRTEPDVDRPLKWLVSAQNDNGGWGAEIKDAAPDVATTAISTASRSSAWATPCRRGTYAATTKKGVGYIVAAVEKTPKEEIAINAPGTLPQRKLGRYIDTFLGAQLLSEALPSMPAGKERDRVKAALQSCVSKIERAQRADGSFSPDGWAGVLIDAFATGGLHAGQGRGREHVGHRREARRGPHARQLRRDDAPLPHADLGRRRALRDGRHGRGGRAHRAR